ncbi:MAG: cytochrome-c peroxidase [Bacteroidia bacterium]|nr:cytochrome-c peroxidase [Bacteroidia bacterium]NNC85266.1 cytochrome-c peroxidase [Bacteroidia bacterium]
MKKGVVIVLVLAIALLFQQCSEDPTVITPPVPPIHTTTPFQIKKPQGFPDIIEPADNRTTVEGLILGRKLFHEPLLSGNNLQSCATCHQQGAGFSDFNQFSMGIDGSIGTRQAMPIMNLVWGTEFFWDGRAFSLEHQALGPVTNPIEMKETWPNAVAELKLDSVYNALFYDAFGTYDYDSTHVVKAIAQFERALISGGETRFDKFLRNEIVLTPSEISGFNIYQSETGGDCFHCHGLSGLMTDNSFHNNGLDSLQDQTDIGRMAVTGDPADRASFKTPSLRNVEYTAPYMHDGRFATLEEVIDFYSEGLHWSPTIDPLMKNVGQGGVQLTPFEKTDLINFLKTMSDPDFLTNPKFEDQ